MRLLDTIGTAQSNLLRSKLRTFLTMLAVIIGTFTLATTTALGEGVKDYIDQQTKAFAQPDSIYIMPKADLGTAFGTGDVKEYDPEKKTGSATQFSFMTNADLEAIRALPDITEANPNYTPTALYVQRDGGKKYVSGIEPLYPLMDLSLAAGSPLDASDQSGAMLPYQLIEPLGFSDPADAVGKTITVAFAPATGSQEEQVFNLTVRGVLINSLFGQNVYVSHDLADAVAQKQSGEGSGFFAVVASTEKDLSADRLAALKKTLDEKGYSSTTYEEQISSIKQVITVVQTVLSFFAVIALIAATIGIVNTLLMAVLERTQEIGLMKALGMRRRAIFSIFTFESISIGFWGAVFGVGLAMIAGNIANGVLAETTFKNLEGFTLLSFPLASMGYIILAAMVVGLIAGALPALRASRLDPITALRAE